MFPSLQKLWVPPVLLALYVVLLLPLFLVPLDTDRLQEDDKILARRLHLKFSLPLALLGFVVVSVLRIGAQQVLFPKNSRRERRADVKWIMLFVLGGIEEAWRWGLVRWLIDLVGGKGGFRGRGQIWDLVASAIGGVEGSKAKPHITNLKVPSIWESVYLMGWTWSFLDCVVLWCFVRPGPLPEVTTPAQPAAHSPPVPPIIITRRESRESRVGGDENRRPLLGKRTRSDYSLKDEGGEGRGLFGSFYRKQQRERGQKVPKLRRLSSGYGTVHWAAMPEPDAGESSTAAVHDRTVDIADQVRQRFKDIDYDAEQTPRAIEHNHHEPSAQSTRPPSSRNSSDSGIYQSQTPLLSSSLPYDPSQQHPHHEEQALLQNRYRTRSYGSMSDSLAMTAAIENDETIVEVHEDDDSVPAVTETVPVEDGPERTNTSPSTERSQGRRVYPSFPSYTSSYHHAYFPAASPTVGPESPSINLRRRCNRPSEDIFGIDVNEFPLYYIVLWAAINLLGHIAHVMFFAWAPALVFDNKFMWWTFFVLALLACKKGVFIAELFGGGAARMGVLRISIFTLSLAILLYIISLGIWGFIW